MTFIELCRSVRDLRCRCAHYSSTLKDPVLQSLVPNIIAQNGGENRMAEGGWMVVLRAKRQVETVAE